MAEREIPLEIDVQTLNDMRDEGEPHVLLDVREAEELDVASLDGTLDIRMMEVPQRLEELPRDVPLVVMCHAGGRSRQVTMFLRQNGFENATNLTGGIDAWSMVIDPNVPRY